MIFFTNRWSCSMMLLRYFICLTVICKGNPPNIHSNASAKLIVLTPALLAPLLSIDGIPPDIHGSLIAGWQSGFSLFNFLSIITAAWYASSNNPSVWRCCINKKTVDIFPHLNYDVQFFSLKAFRGQANLTSEQDPQCEHELNVEKELSLTI